VRVRRDSGQLIGGLPVAQLLYKRVGPPLLRVPVVAGLSGTRFVRTSVIAADGTALGSNFYWTNPDTKAVWPAGSRTNRGTNSPTTWTDYTAIRATLKGTADHPVAPVAVTAEVQNASSPEPGWAARTVKLTNTGNLPALQIHINGFDENNEQILPFIAEDNYVTLMPGESRTLSLKYELASRHGVATIVRVDGFNVAATFATTFTDLEALVTRFSTDPKVTAGLNDKLAAAAASTNQNARDNQLEAFINQVDAQTGKALTAAQAQILTQLARALE
jgi:hypothetical protein